MKIAERNDDLLNDWHIFHFHLGQNVENDGFIERTDPLLFARVTETYFYEINIYGHGNWSNLDLVEIIHKNWPETIENFALNNILGLTYAPTSGDIATLRKNQINSFIQTEDGTIYAPIGGGYMSDGSSTAAVIEAHKNTRYIRQLEKWIKDNPTIIIEEIKKCSDYSENKQFTLRLNIDASGIYALCPEYNMRFVLNKKTIS
jgi:hypothetical protein